MINDEVIRFCKSEGITIEATAPYSPSQNGVAERFNHTLIELVRAMLISKGLPTFLWDEAVSHATYIRNRSPTCALKGKTPFEAWTGKKPNVSHFREFGSDVWVLDESKNRSKLVPKSKKMIFVGFLEGLKVVRYWDKEGRAVRVSRNFAFNEGEELKELQVIEILSLEAEGEGTEGSAPQTASVTQIKQIQDDPKPSDDQNSHNLRTRANKIDYRQLNNPKPIT